MTKSVKAIIAIGGDTTGARFSPLSMDTPKILFPIAGKPLITHIIDSIVSQIFSSLTEVILIGFYSPQLIERYLLSITKTYPNLSIRYLYENFPLGTAGGLLLFKDTIINDNPSSEFFFIHADIICNFPFNQILEFYHSSSNANSLVFGINPLNLINNYHNNNLSHDKPLKLYDQSKNFLTNYGTIVSDKLTNKIIHYVEKPQSNFSKLDQESITEYNVLMNGGIYLFNINFFFDLLDHSKFNKLNSSSQSPSSYQNSNSLSLELDLIKVLTSNEKNNFFVFISKSFWYQIKTPISTLYANRFYLEQELQKNRYKKLAASSLSIVPPVFISSPRQSTSSEFRIGPNVSIGKNVKIGRGVRIKNSIILDDVQIDDNSFIANSIISNNVKIGKWCRIEGSLNYNKKLFDSVSTSDFKLSNNMVIICRGSIIYDETLVYNSIVLPSKEIKNDTKYEIVM